MIKQNGKTKQKFMGKDIIIISVAVLIVAVGLLFYISRLQPQTREPRTFPYKIKNYIWVKQKGICQQCEVGLVPYKGQDNSAEFDHKTPYSKFGKTTIKNCQLLCRSCNRRKSNHK